MVLFSTPVDNKIPVEPPSKRSFTVFALSWLFVQVFVTAFLSVYSWRVENHWIALATYFIINSWLGIMIWGATLPGGGADDDGDNGGVAGQPAQAAPATPCSMLLWLSAVITFLSLNPFLQHVFSEEHKEEPRHHKTLETFWPIVSLIILILSASTLHYMRAVLVGQYKNHEKDLRKVALRSCGAIAGVGIVQLYTMAVALLGFQGLSWEDINEALSRLTVCEWGIGDILQPCCNLNRCMDTLFAPGGGIYYVCNTTDHLSTYGYALCCPLNACYVTDFTAYSSDQAVYRGLLDSLKAIVAGAVLNTSLGQYVMVREILKFWFVDVVDRKFRLFLEGFAVCWQLAVVLCTFLLISLSPGQVYKGITLSSSGGATNDLGDPFVVLLAIIAVAELVLILISCYIARAIKRDNSSYAFFKDRWRRVTEEEDRLNKVEAMVRRHRNRHISTDVRVRRLELRIRDEALRRRQYQFPNCTVA